MKQNTRIIILGILSILIVIVLTLGISKAFMKPIEDGGNLTEISLSSCAKIKLTDNNSIIIENTYPMSRNRGLQTTPYTFTVTSYCDKKVGFNLYITSISDSSIDDTNIHYILTEKGSKVALKEGILAEAKSGKADFVETEINELQIGLYEKMGSIYRIYNEDLPLKGSKDYDLYLFIDINSSNKSMGNKFKAGVSVKAYDKLFETLSEHIISQYTGVQGENNLFYHGENFIEGALDDSYRFGGRIDEVNNNYVCFGSDIEHCPSDNLYRIVGVYGDKTHGIKNSYLVKVVKEYAANSNLLGTDGEYISDENVPYVLGGEKKTSLYAWNSENKNNSYADSKLISLNLNTNYKNNVGKKWMSAITYINWNIGPVIPKELIDAISNEKKVKSTLNQIGLLNISDYAFAGEKGENAVEYSSEWENWLFNNYYHSMTMTPVDDADPILDSNFSYLYTIVGQNGILSNESSFLIRPSFYLGEDTAFIGGDGSYKNPYKIKQPLEMTLVTPSAMPSDFSKVFGENVSSCSASGIGSISSPLQLLEKNEKFYIVSCTNSYSQKVERYVMVDDFEKIYNLNAKYDKPFRIQVDYQETSEQILYLLSEMGFEIEACLKECNYQELASEALNNDVDFIYISDVSISNFNTIYEELKQYGADDIIVISNTYLIENNMLLSDFLEELQ